MALSFVCPAAIAQSDKSAKPAESQPIVTPAEKPSLTNEELQLDPEMALKVLMEGNRRFAAGKTIHPRQDIARIRETAKGQKPFAIIIGCSDSRVPNEIIFDQGLGDLFIVRTAGQVSTYSSWGSIEFAEEILGAKLIFVLGHTRCGAVQAAVQLPEVPGHIVTLINDIKPAVQRVKGKPGDQVQNAIQENVRMQVEKLKNLEPVLAKRVREGKLKIVGGVYDIENGVITMVE
ncbi:MAG: carbonate dehydratase [Chloracidobacterium sp. CP2_5A]|nr:MAG: carbonate dehydratase [Chloracidobacterium sp. CP2_5A]